MGESPRLGTPSPDYSHTEGNSMIFLIIFAALCCCIAVRTLYCTAKVTCDQACSIAESRLNIEPAYFTRAPPALQHKPNNSFTQLYSSPRLCLPSGNRDGGSYPRRKPCRSMRQGFRTAHKYARKTLLFAGSFHQYKETKTMTLAGSATSTTHLCNSLMQ